MDFNKISKLREKYKSNIKEISDNLKGRYFTPMVKPNENLIKITSFDDMFYEMYFKRKYVSNISKNQLNFDHKLTGNIISDLRYLLKSFDRLFLHDIDFKVSKYVPGEFNYFTPNSDNEILLYNSIDMETYQQSEFRKQLWNIEDIIQRRYMNFYKNYDITINFYEDDKYDMVWIILKLAQK